MVNRLTTKPDITWLCWRILTKALLTGCVRAEVKVDLITIAMRTLSNKLTELLLQPPKEPNVWVCFADLCSLTHSHRATAVVQQTLTWRATATGTSSVSIHGVLATGAPPPPTPSCALRTSWTGFTSTYRDCRETSPYSLQSSTAFCVYRHELVRLWRHEVVRV